MAEVINTKKGFKVIKMNFTEATEVCGFGCIEHFVRVIICDNCNDEIHANEDIYFIPVLNRALCKTCFDEWYNSAEYFEEDSDYENDVFEHYYNILFEANCIKLETE